MSTHLFKTRDELIEWFDVKLPDDPNLEYNAATGHVRFKDQDLFIRYSDLVSIQESHGLQLLYDLANRRRTELDGERVAKETQITKEDILVKISKGDAKRRFLRFKRQGMLR